jgi:hypothetical protein
LCNVLWLASRCDAEFPVGALCSDMLHPPMSKSAHIPENCGVIAVRIKLCTMDKSLLLHPRLGKY